MPTSDSHGLAPTTATINEWLALVVSKTDAAGHHAAITSLGEALPEWLAQWWTHSQAGPSTAEVLATVERIYSLRNETMDVWPINEPDPRDVNECQPVFDVWQWDLIPALLNCVAVTALVDPLDVAVVVRCHRLLHYYATTGSARERLIIYQGYLAQQLSPDIVTASDVASTAWALHYLLATFPRLRVRNPVAFLSDLFPLLTSILALIPYQAAFHSVNFSRDLWEQLASTHAPSRPLCSNDINVWSSGDSVLLPDSPFNSLPKPPLEARLVNQVHWQLVVGVHHLSLETLWLVEQLYPLWTPAASAEARIHDESNALSLAMARLTMGVFNIWVPDATGLAEQWFMVAQKRYRLPETNTDRPQSLERFACLASKLPKQRQFLDRLMAYASGTLNGDSEQAVCCYSLLALLFAACTLPDLTDAQPSCSQHLSEPFPFLLSWRQSQSIEKPFNAALVECFERGVVSLLRKPSVVQGGAATSSLYGPADNRGQALLLALVYVQYSQLTQHTPRPASMQLGRNDSVLDALFAFCCTGSANQRLISFRLVHSAIQMPALGEQTQLLTQWVYFLDSPTREHDAHWFHVLPTVAKDGVVQIYTDTLAKASLSTLCDHLLKDKHTRELWRQLFDVTGWPLSCELINRDRWQTWLAADSVGTKQLDPALAQHVILEYGAFMTRLVNLWLFVLLRCQVDQAASDNVYQRYYPELASSFFRPVDRLLAILKLVVRTDTTRSTADTAVSTTAQGLSKDSAYSMAGITRSVELLEMTLGRIAELHPKAAQ
ncbi:hypothetical protein H4R34_000093 [Dimargaris verticillata]|uniref:Uncharacterized protein n=1 Tax=Dimargaris verticillata TaxID=2761393 RepID=A0A9W8EEZ8_9FUNG|nr:hypothetical protein H4R34_000093 [Dimargaris verticillata]